jgi:IPT/TIG domain
VSADFPRTTFVRTDSAPAADNPAGEAHHRHLVYDSAHQHLFIANRAMNRLEVISTIDQSSVAQIAIAGVTSAELSVDGATVWAGTAVNEIVAVDSTSLRVTRRYQQAGISPVPSTVFDRPVEVVSLSNGKCFLRLRQPTFSEALLALWDPAAGSLTNLTAMAPAVFQNGLGPMARTGDYSKAIVAANDSTGNVAVLAPNGGLVTGPKSLGAGSIAWLAANSDGSRFAAVFSSSGTTQVLLLDGSLNQVASRASSGNRGVTFSRDSNFIFVSELASGTAVVTVLDGHDLHVIGQVPGAAIQGVGAQIEDAEETQLLFGVSNRGVSFIDAASPVTLSAAAPSFTAAPASIPSEGPAAGGTALLLSGQNLAADSLLKIGTLAAGNISVLGPTAIQATSPASIANGPVAVTAYSPSNQWPAIAPEAFSYGPKILRVLPNAGVNTGGDSVQITGYGFGSDPSGISVKIGGANAIVESVDNITAIAAQTGLDTTYPFPLERITLQTPPGVAGNADISITAPSGSTTAARSFQYLASAQSYSKPGFFRFIQYDSKRQRVYLTNIDHADVFDLQLGAFVEPIQPPGGPPPNAGWRGLSLTPDGSQLAIADFGVQSVYILNPDTGRRRRNFCGRHLGSCKFRAFARLRHQHSNSVRLDQRRRRLQ